MRRWIDPIRSRWILQRPIRHPRIFKDRTALTVFLRLDDPYSYLFSQILPQFDSGLVAKARPFRVVISTSAALPQHSLTQEQWQHYTFYDATVLAEQHQLMFQEHNHLPQPDLILQGLDILRLTHFQGADFLHLLHNVFHMIWQGQTAKLALLHQMAQGRAKQPSQLDLFSETSFVEFTDKPLEQAYVAFAGRSYLAVDEFSRLTWRLKQYNLINNISMTLLNPVEWRQHLVSDTARLIQIQESRPVLKVYGALEDPFTYLLLYYLKKEMVSYYNIKVKFFALPYQGRDEFDWRLVMSLAKRIGVPFAPFCRPDAAGVTAMARTLSNVRHERRLDRALRLLEDVWSRGFDMSFTSHLVQVLPDVVVNDLTRTEAWLQRNQQGADMLELPELPAFVLKINEQRHAFCGLFRVWQLETLLASGAELNKKIAEV